MHEFDEPALGGEDDVPSEPASQIKARIHRLLESQPYAVLCTQGGGQPYGSVVEALRSSDGEPIRLIATKTARDRPRSEQNHGRPRQLVGQPAAPGCATGQVRTVKCAADIGAFRHGEVLVCRAIEPTMTQLVPLACAIVECRGGMLIHGAIIAREMGIPCVNGVYDAIEILKDNELVTVDGYLGIVSVGQPDFQAEGIDPN